MHLDQILRERTRQATAELRPDVERHLQRTLRRGHRRVALRRTGGAMIVAAAAATVAVLVPRALDSQPKQPSADRPDRHSPAAAILSRSTTTLPDRPGPIRNFGMAGAWTLRLRPNGVAVLSAPSSFTGSLTAVSYELSGPRFRTNAFANDVCGQMPAGTYRWSREHKTLVFATIDDPCQPRVALFTTGPWTVAER